MSLRHLAEYKPASSPPPISSGTPETLGASPDHTRRRRHTVPNHQDKLLRRLSRILVVMGVLMMIWLVLRALGWI